MYDVPPDTSGAIAIGGPAVAVTTTQPGQNGVLTFAGAAMQRVTVHVVGNRMSGVSVRLSSADRATDLAATTSAAGTFSLPPVALPSAGPYTISIDPVGMALGTLNVAVTISQRQ
jgi:hypothetical protein